MRRHAAHIRRHPPCAILLAKTRKGHCLHAKRQIARGLHKLEIELTDDLLSRVDSISARTHNSRAEVVVETLKDHLPAEPATDREAIENRRAFPNEMFEQASRCASNLSDAEIMQQVRE